MQNTSGQCQKLTKLQTTNSVYTNCKMIIVSLVYIQAVGTILGVGTMLTVMVLYVELTRRCAYIWKLHGISSVKRLHASKAGFESVLGLAGLHSFAFNSN